jgi:hypothetical protein
MPAFAPVESPEEGGFGEVEFEGDGDDVGEEVGEEVCEVELAVEVL